MIKLIIKLDFKFVMKFFINMKLSDLVNQSKNETANVKAEMDKLRRQIMYKKRIIEECENKVSMNDGFKILLREIVEDFHLSGRIPMFAENKKDIPNLEAKEYFDLIKNGAFGLIDKHHELSQRFELELKKQMFALEQEKYSLEMILKSKRQDLEQLEQEREHRKKVVKFLLDQKAMLHSTCVLRSEIVNRHKEINTKTIRSYEDKLDVGNTRLNKSMESLNSRNKQIQDLEKSIKDEEELNNMKKEIHDRLIKEYEKISEDMKKQSFEHSCLLSNLSKAKNDLVQLQKTANSYHTNMKSHELMEAERENKRLRYLLRTEKEIRSGKINVQVDRTERIESQQKIITSKIQDIKAQIRLTEHKLNKAIVKVPDFQQLHQVLEKIIQIAKKNKEDVIQTQYTLDELRDKYRMAELNELAKSRERTEKLRMKLPDYVPVDEELLK